MTRVLIVEDSATVRETLRAIFESDPRFEVVGTACDGLDGLRQTALLKPDVVTMDVQMPHLDGIEATRKIMEQCPTPIVIVSAAVDSPELRVSFNAMQAGALDVVEKPVGPTAPGFAAMRDRLLTAAKLMSEVKLVRRSSRSNLPPVRPGVSAAERPQQRPAASSAAGAAPPVAAAPRMVAIGASTGGPAALHRIFKNLPADFPLPIAVVQHITAGFTAGLVSWLQTECLLKLEILRYAEHPQPGKIYFAPDDHHIEVASRDSLVLSRAAPVRHVRPSADVLFNSAARVLKSSVIGVLLTGMGEDGAAGLKAIHDQGGATIAQDEASCVVYGMPKAAANLGAAAQILPLDQIAGAIQALCMRS